MGIDTNRTDDRLFNQPLPTGGMPVSSSAHATLIGRMTVIYDELTAGLITADRENGTTTLRDAGFTALADAVGL